MAALGRGSVAQYHLRASYLGMRLAMVRRYLGEFLFAPSFVRRRLARVRRVGKRRALHAEHASRAAAA